jgi:hypothetical protein
VMRARLVKLFDPGSVRLPRSGVFGGMSWATDTVASLQFPGNSLQ